MTHVALTQGPPELSEALDKMDKDGERIVLEKNGVAVGAIVSIEDLKALERLEDLLDASDYRSALEEWEHDGKRTVSLDDLLSRYTGKECIG